MSQATIGTIRGRVMGIRTDGSSYSIPTCVVMGSRPDGPLYPSAVTVTPTLDSILLRWTAPTKNADGTTLNSGAINGYWVYEKESEAPTKDVYDDRFWVEGLVFPWPAENVNTHYFGLTTVNNSGQQSDISSSVSSKANFSNDYDNDVDNPTGGLHVSDVYIGFYDSVESEWVAYMKNDGTFYLKGYDALGSWGDSFFQWSPGSSTPGNPATLIVEGTYKTDSDTTVSRIQIMGSGSDDGWLFAMDGSDKERVGLYSTGIEIWNASGKGSANRLLYVSSTATDDVIIKHDNIIVEKTLIIGRTTDPATSDDLYVEDAARLGSGSTAVDLVVGDHGTASTDQVINVCYGTSSAPTASTTTIGSLFVKYTA